MSRRSHVAIALIFILSAALLYPAGLGATTVRRMGLREIIQAADRVFVGTCLDVRNVRDAYGLPSTFVSFSVQETIKGKLGGVLTIKMIGGGAGTFRIEGMPRFRVGEEVLLALYPDSEYGFTSPVGLQQGKWAVVKTASGKKMLRRSLEGAAILETRPATPHTEYGEDSSGMIDYIRFIGLVKRLARR